VGRASVPAIQCATGSLRYQMNGLLQTATIADGLCQGSARQKVPTPDLAGAEARPTVEAKFLKFQI